MVEGWVCGNLMCLRGGRFCLWKVLVCGGMLCATESQANHQVTWDYCELLIGSGSDCDCGIIADTEWRGGVK